MSVVELWLAFTANFQEKRRLTGNKVIDSGSQFLDRNQLLHPLTLLTAAEQEDLEERSAIMEFDAGLSREEAERQALRIILTKRMMN